MQKKNVCGSLRFFKKDGTAGSPFLLHSGQEFSIGYDSEASIRLKAPKSTLKSIQCVVKVDTNGRAKVINKETSVPLKLNSKPLYGSSYLIPNDTFYVCDKKIRYENDSMTQEEIASLKLKKATCSKLRLSSRAALKTPSSLGKLKNRLKPSIKRNLASSLLVESDKKVSTTLKSFQSLKGSKTPCIASSSKNRFFETEINNTFVITPTKSEIYSNVKTPVSGVKRLLPHCLSVQPKIKSSRFDTIRKNDSMLNLERETETPRNKSVTFNKSSPVDSEELEKLESMSSVGKNLIVFSTPPSNLSVVDINSTPLPSVQKRRSRKSKNIENDSLLLPEHAKCTPALRMRSGESLLTYMYENISDAENTHTPNNASAMKSIRIATPTDDTLEGLSPITTERLSPKRNSLKPLTPSEEQFLPTTSTTRKSSRHLRSTVPEAESVLISPLKSVSLHSSRTALVFGNSGRKESRGQSSSMLFKETVLPSPSASKKQTTHFSSTLPQQNKLPDFVTKRRKHLGSTFFGEVHGGQEDRVLSARNSLLEHLPNENASRTSRSFVLVGEANLNLETTFKKISFRKSSTVSQKKDSFSEVSLQTESLRQSGSIVAKETSYLKNARRNTRASQDLNSLEAQVYTDYYNDGQTEQLDSSCCDDAAAEGSEEFLNELQQTKCDYHISSKSMNILTASPTVNIPMTKLATDFSRELRRRSSPKRYPSDSCSDQENVPTNSESSFETDIASSSLLETTDSSSFYYEKSTDSGKKSSVNFSEQLPGISADPMDLTIPCTKPKIMRPARISKHQVSPKNDLSNITGVRKLVATPKEMKGPKNDVSDEVRGVRKLKQTPSQHRSPRNDLTNVQGVKWLMQTPRKHHSPKNDLSNVAGVKKLMRTPKKQSSPKNDLSNVNGVRKLMASPKEIKQPNNDLSDVRGVRKLMQTPRKHRSPRNDLTNVCGVKQLMRTPKKQSSPKNDLSNVAGVRKLMATPKDRKEPINDLTDVRGIRKLMQAPHQVQRSPVNDLSNVQGVKRLMRSPKVMMSPKNDLSDVSGVRKLMQTPEYQKSSDLSNIRDQIKTPTMSEARITDHQQLLSESDNFKSFKLTPTSSSALYNRDTLESSSSLQESVGTLELSPIVNDSTLSNFDILLNKRPLRTYRGKSASPLKIKSVAIARNSEGAKIKVKPEVEKWVEEHTKCIRPSTGLCEFTTNNSLHEYSTIGLNNEMPSEVTEGVRKSVHAREKALLTDASSSGSIANNSVHVIRKPVKRAVRNRRSKSVELNLSQTKTNNKRLKKVERKRESLSLDKKFTSTPDLKPIPEIKMPTISPLEKETVVRVTRRRAKVQSNNQEQFADANVKVESNTSFKGTSQKRRRRLLQSNDDTDVADGYNTRNTAENQSSEIAIHGTRKVTRRRAAQTNETQLPKPDQTETSPEAMQKNRQGRGAKAKKESSEISGISEKNRNTRGEGKTKHNIEIDAELIAEKNATIVSRTRRAGNRNNNNKDANAADLESAKGTDHVNHHNDQTKPTVSSSKRGKNKQKNQVEETPPESAKASEHVHHHSEKTEPSKNKRGSNKQKNQVEDAPLESAKATEHMNHYDEEIKPTISRSRRGINKRQNQVEETLLESAKATEQVNHYNEETKPKVSRSTRGKNKQENQVEETPPESAKANEHVHHHSEETKPSRNKRGSNKQKSQVEDAPLQSAKANEHMNHYDEEVKPTILRSKRGINKRQNQVEGTLPESAKANEHVHQNSEETGPSRNKRGRNKQKNQVTPPVVAATVEGTASKTRAKKQISDAVNSSVSIEAAVTNAKKVVRFNTEVSSVRRSNRTPKMSKCISSGDFELDVGKMCQVKTKKSQNKRVMKIKDDAVDDSPKRVTRKRRILDMDIASPAKESIRKSKRTRK